MTGGVANASVFTVTLDPQAEADEMVDGIKEAFKNTLTELTWIDADTAAAAGKKADQVRKYRP